MSKEKCELIAKMFNDLQIEDRTDWTADEIRNENPHVFFSVAKMYYELAEV